MTQISNGNYNNPFVATLFPNDEEFIKLCCNLKAYVNLEPALDLPKKTTPFYNQYGTEWWCTPTIKPYIPYPVIHLGDVEIHLIHEQDTKETFEKFCRRNERLQDFIKKDDGKIVCVLSFANLFQNYEDCSPIIDRFLSNNTENVVSLFAGPRYLYKPEYDDKYILVDEWNDAALVRLEGIGPYDISNKINLPKLFVDYIRRNF